MLNNRFYQETFSYRKNTCNFTKNKKETFTSRKCLFPQTTSIRIASPQSRANLISKISSLIVDILT